MNVIITGGFGFIGSHVTKHFVDNLRAKVHVLDSETYASKKEETTQMIGGMFSHSKTDIRDRDEVSKKVKEIKPDVIIHLAAESHVCNSIKGPRLFYETNLMGTVNLLEAVREFSKDTFFVHVSTDEVYGELDENPKNKFHEETPLDPRSPYSSSKAASDMAVLAYHRTYGINALITNCTNNYGPNQHDEKLIPRTVKKILDNEPVTIYGKGNQVRDWLYVEDHATALETVLMSGTPGEKYMIGGDNEMTNLQMVHHIHRSVERLRGVKPLDIIFTNDRPTDDFRYAAHTNKLKNLGWRPTTQFENMLDLTVESIILEHERDMRL